ncbi:hypothetical protein, partial [Salmonella sp. SAL4437]|uniref:hypothetical protein n=1 Tax=Salmonella sp. SAL4437 TaxID=3159892 RepID=UPI00397B42FB
QRYRFHKTRNLKYENKSDSGYGSTVTICVAMIERLTGKTWETVMTELLTNTLQLQMKFGRLPNGMEFHPYNDAQGKYLPDPTYN